jgi:hypothetical protein
MDKSDDIGDQPSVPALACDQNIELVNEPERFQFGVEIEAIFEPRLAQPDPNAEPEPQGLSHIFPEKSLASSMTKYHNAKVGDMPGIARMDMHGGFDRLFSRYNNYAMWQLKLEHSIVVSNREMDTACQYPPPGEWWAPRCLVCID